MQRRASTALGGAAALASLALVLAGCTAGGSGGEPTDGGSASEYPDYLRNPLTGECTVEPAEGVDLAGATDYIQPWLEESAGVTADILGFGPLKGEVPDGLRIGYANNNTAVGDALWRPYVEAAAQTVGAEFINYITGPDPQSAATGFDAILADPPDILVVGAVSPRTVEEQGKALIDAGVAVVWGADPFAEEVFGINDTIGGMGGSIVNGEVLAAAAVHYTCGAANDFAWYNITELEFSGVNLTAAEAFLAELAPDATLRSVDVSIGVQDATASIIPDLQGHPDTQFFVTPGDQFQVGIKAAAETAGVANWFGIGQSSLRANVDAIIANEQYGGYTLDFEQFMFQLVDEGLRKYLGEWPAAGYGDNWELINSNMSTLITPANAESLDIDANGIYTSYPNTAADYAALWGK